MGKAEDRNQAAATELRRRAEARMQAMASDADLPRSEAETQRLLHELQVHQIELELQNAELLEARNEAETALEKFTHLYDFAPVSYFTLDRAGVISAVNLTGASLLGIERSRLLGRRFGLFVAVNARPFFAEFLQTVFARQNREFCEVPLTPEGGPPLLVQVEAAAGQSGDQCRLAIIDISERSKLKKKLEHLHAELEVRAADLEAANIELDAFNYTVSHDLRLPLTVISGYCQVLEELLGPQLDGQSRGYLQEIHQGTQRMEQLIDTLLEFSRVTRVTMVRKSVDLSAMAKAVAAELTLRGSDQQSNFRIAEGLEAEGDPELLRVVLNNLLGNAWKYAGGRAWAVIDFGRSEADGVPVFFVRDNGPGFNMAHAEQLFLPFQRLPGTEVEGHGIGLATVERIVRRHGGRIWAESEPGRGATFWFTLEEAPTI